VIITTWMINDGDRHGYKTRSSTGCILYTVIITIWIINDVDRHGPGLSPSFIIHVVIITVYNIQPVLDLVLYPCLTKLDQVPAVYYIL
jgi:hypothetical protein